MRRTSPEATGYCRRMPQPVDHSSGGPENCPPCRSSAQVETNCTYFLIIGSGLAVITYISTVCGIISSERQANRIRVAYLKAMLRQDVGWFDVNKPGEVASRMQEDTASVQGGINESIGLAVQYLMSEAGTAAEGCIVGAAAPLCARADPRPLQVQPSSSASSLASSAAGR